MKSVYMILALVVSFSGLTSRAETLDLKTVISRVMDTSSDNVRARELTQVACADIQGFIQARALVVEKIQALQEEEKALIIQINTLPEDTPFRFQKSNMKGHAARKGYQSVMLGQRLIFMDQAIERCGH